MLALAAPRKEYPLAPFQLIWTCDLMHKPSTVLIHLLTDSCKYLTYQVEGQIDLETFIAHNKGQLSISQHTRPVPGMP
jgi:hypothetical protein